MKLLALTSLLAVSALLAKSSLTYYDDDSYTCINRLLDHCIEPNLDAHEATFVSEDVALAVLTNRALLDQLAADVQAANDCTETELAYPACKEVNMRNTEYYNELRLIAGYLNSSYHLDVLQAAASTPCLGNEELVERARMGLLMCYWPFLEEVQAKQDMCHALSVLQNCSVNVVTTVCRDGAGAFIQSLWDYMEEPEVHDIVVSMVEIPPAMADPFGDCQQEASAVKRFAKRALQKLRR